MTIELGQLNQTCDGCGALDRQWAPGELPVATSCCPRTDFQLITIEKWPDKFGQRDNLKFWAQCQAETGLS